MLVPHPVTAPAAFSLDQFSSTTTVTAPAAAKIPADRERHNGHRRERGSHICCDPDHDRSCGDEHDAVRSDDTGLDAR